MQRSRRRVPTLTTAVSLGLAAVLALGACSSSGGGSGGNGTASAGAVSGSISVWMSDPIGQAQQPIIKDIAHSYEQAHPGTKIDLRFLGSDAQQVYLTSIAGNSTPCVALVGNSWTPQFAGLGALQVYANDPSTMKGKYVQSMIDSTVLDGKSYGVPYDVGVRALIYRKDLLEAAGQSVPKTWNDLVTAATAIQTKNPGVSGFGVIGSSIWYFLPMIWNWGGQIATQSNGKWQGQVDSTQAQQAFAFYADLLTKYKLAPSGAAAWGGADADKAMALGKLAMMVGGSWDLQTILTQTPDMKDKLATAVIPAGPGGNNDTFAGGSNLVMFKGCNNEATAKSFISYMTSPANLIKITSNVGLMPATTDALATERTTGSFSSPLLKAFAAQVEHSRAVPASPNWGKVEDSGAFVNTMQAIMNGKDPAAEMKDLNSQITSALAG